MIFVILLFVEFLSHCNALQVGRKEVYDTTYLCGILNTLGYSIDIQRPGRLAKTFQSFNIVSITSPQGNVVMSNKKLGGDVYEKLIEIIHRSSIIRLTTKSRKNKNGFSPLTGMTINNKIYDYNFHENLSLLGESFNERIKSYFESQNILHLSPCNELFKELKSFVPNSCQVHFVQYLLPSSQLSFIPTSSTPSLISPTTTLDQQQEFQPTYELLIPDFSRQGYLDLAQINN
ncbi:hypothetical protein ENUP19_0097G0011 [Entamoeba nuttalli]|uniref:Uncharacterized protein n=2 Tax=Entamoeba nuttalli TaxID=412467 RepID=K2H0A7_ENTNP|nr:hypothetical protein ENU1_075270 [Entamoeba nuttalli P19]EKE40918.1 hypothetical protein ENU1_075270 [Entamoeba nuttalli P19]|eukprot:XP_008856745.1 hypothetical protein ENU1_075270 [Entamoeba nuttalli P19]